MTSTRVRSNEDENEDEDEGEDESFANAVRVEAPLFQELHVP